MTEDEADGTPPGFAGSSRAALTKILAAVSDPMTRALLEEVVSHEEPRTIHGLATAIAKRMDSDVERVHVRLRHQVIPHLEQQGFVNVDWESRRVTPTEAARTVRAVIEDAQDR